MGMGQSLWDKGGESWTLAEGWLEERERECGAGPSVRCRLRTGSKPLVGGGAWTEELLKTTC